MNKLSLLLGLAAAISVERACATHISSCTTPVEIVVAGPAPTQEGNLRYEFFLNIDTNCVFDTLDIELLSDGQFNQVGEPGAPVVQPSEDTGMSALLYAPLSFGGFGLSGIIHGSRSDSSSRMYGIASDPDGSIELQHEPISCSLRR